jgi:hypothetical protein
VAPRDQGHLAQCASCSPPPPRQASQDHLEQGVHGQQQRQSVSQPAMGVSATCRIPATTCGCTLPATRCTTELMQVMTTLRVQVAYTRSTIRCKQDCRRQQRRLLACSATESSRTSSCCLSAATNSQVCKHLSACCAESHLGGALAGTPFQASQIQGKCQDVCWAEEPPIPTQATMST